MRTTSLLKAIPLSFWSSNLYREVAVSWPGLGYIYLLLVTALCILPMQAFITLGTSTVTLSDPVDAEYILKQIPPMHFERGTLTVDVAQPYTISMRESEEFKIIIDTEHPVTDWSEKKFQGAVFGKTQMMTLMEKTSGHGQESRLHTYAPEINHTVTREEVTGWAEKAISWLTPLSLALYPFLVLSVFLYRIIQMLVYGLIGLGIAKILRTTLIYADCIRLASLAITPLMILEMLAGLIDITIPWWAAFVLAMGYLFYAVKSNAPAQR